MYDCLLKFGREKSHLTDFVKKGHIYLNSISFFTSCEREATGLHDRFDNVDFYSHGKGAKLTLNGRDFNIAGPVGICDGRNPWTHLFCSYLLSDESVNRRPDNSVYCDSLWEEFGEYVVLIHNVKEFCKLLCAELNNRKYFYRSNIVEYFDEANHEGKVGPFLKRSIYKHQEEYRFAIKADSKEGPIEDLFLGSLEHICHGPVHRSKCKNIRSGDHIEI